MASGKNTYEITKAQAAIASFKADAEKLLSEPPPRETMRPAEIAAELKTVIAALRRHGYTYAQIRERIAQHGVNLSESTLRTNASTGKRRGKKAADHTAQTGASND